MSSKRFGLDMASAVLAEVDPDTGRSVPIGETGFDFPAGLEIRNDGALLGSLGGGVDPMAGGLVNIDPATGAGAFIDFTGFTPVSGLTKLP
jgi:hypothetical protein